MRNCALAPRPWSFAALASLALAAAPAARAQVKLEYKFPEGQKLTYKTTSKTSQVLTLMGQPMRPSPRRPSSPRDRRQRSGPTAPCRSTRRWIRSPWSFLCPWASSSRSTPRTPTPRSITRIWLLVEVYKLASESSYTVVLDGQNKVKAIEGTEKLLEKADKLENPIAKQPIRSRVEAGQAQGPVRAVAPQPAGRPGPPGRTLGADRERRHRRRPEPHLPQEVRVRRHREEGGQDARQDQQQDPRGQVRDGPQRPLGRSR